MCLKAHQSGIPRTVECLKSRKKPKKMTTTTETTSDLALHKCPCCGAQAKVSCSTVEDYVLIVCGKKGCVIVSAQTIPEAVKLWNERTFRD